MPTTLDLYGRMDSPPLIIMTRIPLILSLLALLPASAIAQSTWYVPDDFPTIQDGIDGSSDGDSVIVRDGTYYENINFNGKAITLKSENGPGTTMIDGSQAGTVVTIASGEGSDSVFEGFTVTNGNAAYGGGMSCRYNSSPTLENCTFTGNTATSSGGGMYCEEYSSPILENCMFRNNTAANYGGGMYCYYSSPTLNNCTFTENVASTHGSGMDCFRSSPTLNNCTFTNNTAGTWGGGMYCFGSSLTLNNCTFTNNMAGTRGGGMYCRYSSSLTLENCMFTNNTAGTWGGGMYCLDSSPTLNNCTFTNNTANRGGGMYCLGSSPTLNNGTFTNNTATNNGGGMSCGDSSSPTLTNCILWENHAMNGSEIYKDASSTTTVAYSDIKGGWTGTGNIAADPLFIDAINSDFNLQAGSPCIDTGDPNSSLDPDGTRADIGAFYFDQSGSTPTLSVSNLVAGKQVLVEVTNATPINFSHFAWSIHGGGPTPTPWGDAMVTPPYHLTLLPTDSNGYASYTANIPSAAAGITVWCHGTDVRTQSMLNSLMLVIQ